ncbi:hypothetical protein [Confluentibacter sediminis]|uniref:hypothetical protein n=1 Tax=Confluentibacter sediminis TaxID=2219045 RepID=UPI000DAC363F|nr:hypothetical protein [Confluentibacter sediminis]
MDKKLKKGLIIGISVAIVLVIGILCLNFFIKNKLKNGLDNLSKTVKIQYQDIHVNTLTGSVALINPHIFIYGKATHNITAEIELKKIAISNLSYWDYFFNDKISVEDILLNDPKVIYNHNELVSLKSSQNSYKDDFKKNIDIETIEIVNGNVQVFNVSNDSLLLKSEDVNFKVNTISVKKSNLKHKIPITFKDYYLTYNNLFYKLNDYDNLFLKHADFNMDFYKIKDLSIKTKYSKEALSKHISVERDYFDLTVDSLLVEKPDFGIKNDSVFYFESNQVNVYHPNFKVYRDKLVADDLSSKPLYSKSLRDLDFNLTLNTVLLKNAHIIYTEKVKEETKGGDLVFSKLNAKINNVGNTYKSDNKTSAHIEAFFMEDAPLNVDWSFDVNDINDEFIFKAEIGTLDANHMNQFMEPNLNLKLNGQINKTYFTINGTDNTSLIDLKLQYDDFEVIMLQQNGKEKNKFLSGIINLFVSKDSKDTSNEFRFGSAKDVERDKTKSVFNYLWLNIKPALLNAMTGDGKEKTK